MTVRRVWRVRSFLLGLAAVASACGGGGGAGGGGGDDPPGGNTAPEVAIESVDPAGDVQRGTVVSVRYRDEDPDDDAATSLVADRDGNLDTTGDQVVLAEGRPELDGASQTVAWDTSGAPTGAYTVYAVTSDGFNPPVVRAADFAVVVGSLVAPDTITVKDASGHGSGPWPVTAVVPLEAGRFQDADGLALVDFSGQPVPAQFSALNRWWHGDDSIRHLLVSFQTTVPERGTRAYRLEASGTAGPLPARSVTVTTSSTRITVDTGAVRFSIRKTGFNLFDEVHVDADGNGSYAASERIVAPGASAGPVLTGRLLDEQSASDRTDLRVEVEEDGPMRAILRVSAPTIFTSTTDHTHGFAIRIYAYAGQPIVRVDYQLQNSARNVRYSWPLYFEDLSLHVKPELTSPVVRLSPVTGTVWTGGPGAYLQQSSLADASVRSSANNSALVTGSVANGQSSHGWADVSDGTLGMAMFVRHMAEMWPNEIEVSADGNAAVRLWPRRGAQWIDGAASPTGLYWLDDMQHVVKEVLFYFHGPGVAAADLDQVAQTFQNPPAPFASLAEYRATAVTVDLLGIFPREEMLPGPDSYKITPPATELSPTSDSYAFGWMNFGGDPGRKNAATAGGWPDSAANAMASHRIDHLMRAERNMWGDLNVRPQWIDGYDHDDDFSLIKPTVNPYGGDSWRAFEGHGTPWLAAPYLAGTASVGWTPRDNEHGWFYHLEEYYLLTGNPWIRDWYRFIAEFRKRTLFQTGVEDPADPYFEWGWGTRGEAHMLTNCVQAYRVTGDAQLLEGIKNRIDWLHEKRLHAQWGTCNPQSESAFQMGYIARAFLDVWRELRDVDPEYAAKAFLLYGGSVDWNHHVGRWCYYVNSTTDTSALPSDGTALTMVDPASAFYLLTGRRDVLDDTIAYVDTGINGGQRPYGAFPDWQGGYEARMHEYARAHLKPSETPPAAVANLAAAPGGGAGTATLSWTAPTDAARYLVVWSRLPISPTYTKNPALRNFWVGNLVPCDLVARPGQAESLPATGLPSGTQVWFALVSFDEGDNMSAVSNVATLTVP